MADIISLCTDKIAAVHPISALFLLGYIYLSVSHTEILTVALTLSTRKLPCALRLVPEKFHNHCTVRLVSPTQAYRQLSWPILFCLLAHWWFVLEQRKRDAEGSDEDKDTPSKHDKKKSKKDKKKAKEKEKESSDEVSNSIYTIFLWQLTFL